MGVDRMDYTLIFSEDLKQTTGGQIVLKKSNGQVCGKRELSLGYYQIMD